MTEWTICDRCGEVMQDTPTSILRVNSRVEWGFGEIWDGTEKGHLCESCTNTIIANVVNPDLEKKQ